MILRGASITRDIELKADVCVVGTGAGGAMALRELARAGLAVVGFEEGPHLSRRDFTQREDEMIPLLFQEAGGRQTEDGAITVLQGRGVGGSTVHNTNLCKRAAPEVLASWKLQSWTAEAMAPHYEVVERDLSVTQLEDGNLNRNNRLFRAGVEKLGWKGGLLKHNRKGCAASGFCELGCPFDAKENAAKILVPDAVAHDARLYAECRVERILVERGRASGVVARALDANGKPGAAITVHARAVVVAGSAVGSVKLLRESEIADPHRQIGRSLRLHPGAAVAGVFDDPVEGWVGIPQSYECTEWLRFDDPSDERRAWIVSAFAHPAGMASLLPGFGADHMRAMRMFPRIACLAAMVHDQTRGIIAVDGGRVRIRYQLELGDQRAMIAGMAACAEILFAAGAKQVWVPFAEPLQLTSPSEIAKIRAHVYRPLDPLLTAVHPMGSLPMSHNPRDGAVNERGEHHQVPGLYVADGSLFPTSLGGPPQLTIYAAGHKVAGHVREDLK